MRPEPARPAGLSAGAWLGAGALLLLAWDASGADMALQHLAGGPHGFIWREAWLTRALLHDGGREAAWGLMAVLAWDAWRPLRAGPTRAERAYWLGVALLSALAVSVLKQLSLSSCPWDLAEFGGHALYRSHWQVWAGDGGPGHCFPSGHAVSAFAFIGQYFLWRPHRPVLARRLRAGVLVAGVVFALAQWLRGAHFLSHSLWTAWLCAAVAVAAQALQQQRARRARAAGPPVGESVGAGQTG